MRFSELAGKEIISLDEGSRLGIAGDTDLVIDPESGQIDSLVLPGSRSFWTIFSRAPETTIPWSEIKKIGLDLVIIDRSESHHQQPHFRKAKSPSITHLETWSRSR